MRLCRIADLTVSVPAAGGLAPRCEEYLAEFAGPVDIFIDKNMYQQDRYPQNRPELVAYMESGKQFYLQLLRYNGLMLHASAVELDGKAYLFSGPCRTGKSTHTRMWKTVFGDKACVFNDDKPALRCVDGIWYAYGTPWCGKDGINSNKKVPLVGICFLKQAPVNAIRKLPQSEAVGNLIYQTIHNLSDVRQMDLLLESVEKLIRQVPVFEMENRPESDAVWLSFETMFRAAQEAGL